MHDAEVVRSKVALVTGASRGIGRAIAERLASDGAEVIVNFTKDEASARAVVEGIRARGGKAHAHRADVSRVAEIRGMVAEIVERHGRLDVVVANAGTAVFKPTQLVSEEEFDRVFSLNARGTYFLLQEAANHLSDGGRIVVVSTGGTAAGSMPGAGLYVASKSAVEHFARSLAKEVGARGITVNIVSPGITQTDGMVLPKEAVDQLVSATALGRLGRPSDIASVVAFLVGPDGSWVDGANIQASGGI